MFVNSKRFAYHWSHSSATFLLVSLAFYSWKRHFHFRISLINNYYCSRCFSWPNHVHLNRPLVHLALMFSTFITYTSLISSRLTRHFLVNPHVHAHIFISAASNFLFCWVAMAWCPSHIAGLVNCRSVKCFLWLLVVYRPILLLHPQHSWHPLLVILSRFHSSPYFHVYSTVVCITLPCKLCLQLNTKSKNKIIGLY